MTHTRHGLTRAAAILAGLLAGGGLIGCGSSPPDPAAAADEAAASVTAREEERSFDDFLAEVEQAAAQAEVGEPTPDVGAAGQRSGQDTPPQPPAPAAATALPDFSGWHKGATGYRAALNEFAGGDKALAVYFYTDWCGYCRKFNSELLAVGLVERHLDGLIAVMINPDEGGESEALAATWGVTGYPTFLIVPPGQERGVPIAPFTLAGGKARTLAPSEFVRHCKEAAEP